MAVASAIAQISITVSMSGFEVVVAEVVAELQRQLLAGAEEVHPTVLFYFRSSFFLLFPLSTSPDNVLLPFKSSTVNSVVWSLNLIKSD